jgi:hypothetical protein
MSSFQHFEHDQRLYSKRNVGYGYGTLELTITSPLSCILDYRVNLFTATMTISDNCFPNFSKMKQLIGKWRVRGRGREGVGADFMS